jgi:hypothetical protein
MSHDNYDDGLVHSHGWATQQPAHTTGHASRRAEVAAAMAQHPEEVECFDDGLVHAHGWASAERGRMAQR